MSMEDGQSNDVRTELLNITRRRLLQSAGVSIGTLGGLGVGTGAVGAKSGCANGPFEASYSGGVVNVGEIRAEQAQETNPEPMAPGSPGKGDPMEARGHTPPVQNAQESMTDQEGPLTIRTEFEGVNSLETRGGVPSDSQVAAGDGKILHALNRNIAIYNKRSGQREQLFRLERLWEPVIPEPEGGFVTGVPFVFDPRARYDRNHERYIVAATQYQLGITGDGERIDREDLEEAVEEGSAEEFQPDGGRPPKGWFLVAVSATSNPNGKWYVYRIPPEDDGGVDNLGLVDYPTLGFDKDTIYLTQNFFGMLGEFDVTMVTLNKHQMYSGSEVDAFHFDGMLDPDADGLTFTVHPTQQPFSGGEDGTFYMINSDFPAPFPGPTSTVTLWEVTNPISNPSVRCFTIDVDPYSYPPAARQPDTNTTLIDTLGTRVMNADFNSGSIWTAHSTAVDWNDDGTPVAAIRWYEIDVDSRSVVQSGTYGEPDTSYFMPTIGSEGDSTIIVHNVAGPDTYVRMDVAGRTVDHTVGELEDSVVVEEGKSKYVALPDDVYGPVERWGDYNGFSVDPASGRFWTVSQYSPDIDIPESDETRDPYFTRFAEVYFNKNEMGKSNGGGPS